MPKMVVVEQSGNVIFLAWFTIRPFSAVVDIWTYNSFGYVATQIWDITSASKLLVIWLWWSSHKPTRCHAMLTKLCTTVSHSDSSEVTFFLICEAFCTHRVAPTLAQPLLTSLLIALAAAGFNYINYSIDMTTGQLNLCSSPVLLSLPDTWRFLSGHVCCCPYLTLEAFSQGMCACDGWRWWLSQALMLMSRDAGSCTRYIQKVVGQSPILYYLCRILVFVVWKWQDLCHCQQLSINIYCIAPMTNVLWLFIQISVQASCLAVPF